VGQTVQADTLRSLAYGSIGSSFVAVGTALSYPARIVCFTNECDTDMTISDDGSNEKFIIPKGSFKLFDLNSNRTNADQVWLYPAGTQFSVKYVSAPGSGLVYVEVLH
jgi:hypothetical protein